MKKVILVLLLVNSLSAAIAQSAEDLFKVSDVKISWLGLDFSHLKLIGDFSQFKDAGASSPSEIRDKYFPAWNGLIINEPEKYNIKGMLRKENIEYDIDMVTELNSKTPLEEMESNISPNYKIEDVTKFVSAYKLSGKSGIGVAFIVESFNKPAEQAIIHFVAINLATKEILLYEKITGKPGGFGLRNYWAGSVSNVINQINKTYYSKWKAKYKN